MYFRLLWISLKLSMLYELEYRVNFVVQLIQVLLSLLVSLGGLRLIFSHTETLAGWKSTELLAVVGVYFVIGAFIGMIIKPNMQRLMEGVRDGTLDFTLTKPADSQVLVSLQHFAIWKVVDLFIGLVVLAIALSQMDAQVGFSHAVAFAVMLLAGGVTVYSFYLILATCSFWLVRVENMLVIFQSLYEAGRWPVSIYPGWLRFILTFLVPVAFAVTVPAESLTDRLTGETQVAALGLAGALLIISRKFWKLGVRSYTGASA